MRVMVIVKATEDSEKGFRPTPESKAVMEAMGKFNDELRKAGILRTADGLKPSSHGKRIAFDGPGRTVVDGPFAHPSELVAGFLALGGEGHGRGGRLGEALPQSHAGTERDRNPAAVRDGRFAMSLRAARRHLHRRNSIAAPDITSFAMSRRG
jgi:hypothetical protein